MSVSSLFDRQRRWTQIGEEEMQGKLILVKYAEELKDYKSSWFNYDYPDIWLFYNF